MIKVLHKKNILLGVTGGIAAYKTAELLRLFIKEGANVQVVMTSNAAEFVTPLTFRTLSGNPVATNTFSAESDSGIDHIQYTDWADLFIIAPSTANIIGKMASGIGDDLLSTLALAFDGPFLIAPAMNSKMYKNSIVQENLKRLKSHGYHFVGPDSGDLACGYEDVGRMSEPAVILEKSISILTEKNLVGKKIVVTAGPTREDIDPVRFISNRSSGKMGYAVALEAKRRGADVTLISGPSSVKPPQGVNFKSVVSAEDMFKAVTENVENSDVLIMSAAVADFTPFEISDKKIKKGKKEKESIKLISTTDILSDMGNKKGSMLVVGFAAETDNVIENASKKLREKKVDLIIANDVSAEGVGFDVDTNKVYILDSTGVIEETELLSKSEVATKIIDTVSAKLSIESATKYQYIVN